MGGARDGPSSVPARSFGRRRTDAARDVCELVDAAVDGAVVLALGRGQHVGEEFAVAHLRVNRSRVRKPDKVVMRLPVARVTPGALRVPASSSPGGGYRSSTGEAIRPVGLGVDVGRVPSRLASAEPFTETRRRRRQAVPARPPPRQLAAPRPGERC
jgi:hypothetical protein